ncbi:heme ABC exporter ATP-binding protein CcmA [Panacagrimonas sp.]|uniref:heme ABC exporter ATP-binding protein CcmA n=1 Tax=Panacagrimonas sp. TaxID=2480088 RepID=UPI003B52D843
MALLTASGLAVGRGDRQLLGGLYFVIEPGDVLHVRGRNGAGKSSLIEVLVGLRPPLAGEVQAPPPSSLHWIGHRNGLNADLSVRENLLDWCGLQRLSSTHLQPALERLGLNRLQHRPVRTLSAGQRRRAALARLLIDARPLWLLDEPLSGLDAEGVRWFGEVLDEHVAADGAVMITSHQKLPGRLPRLRVMELR